MTASSTPGAPVPVAPDRGTPLDTAVDAARRVVDALLRTGDGTPADLAGAAARLNAVADDLAPHAPPLADRMEGMWSGGGMTRHDPAAGPENAIAPPLRLTGQADGSVTGTITLGLAYQGPPGGVHGGMTALLLDHALGMATHWSGTPGMTATLTLRYSRPTPLFRPLTVRAHRESIDGRRIRAVGTIAADGATCVTAEGTFVAVDHRPAPARPEE